MKSRVKIIKKSPGFTLGEEKNLTLNEAKHLESKGIAKIIERKSVDSLADIVSNLEEIVIEQGKKITALEKLISKK